MKPLSILCAMLMLALIGCASTPPVNEPVWIDVRSAEEYSGGHVSGALNIPHDQIGEQISSLDLSSDQEILLYCRSGRRADMARETLLGMGYSNVTNLGGYEDALASPAHGREAGER